MPQQWEADQWSLSLMQNENLLPTQVEPRIGRESGCTLLAKRVFEKTWEDYLRFHPTRRAGRQGALLYETARAWFDSDDNFCLSFHWICDVFGWEIDWVRRKLHDDVASGRRIAVRQISAGRGPGKITAGD